MSPNNDTKTEMPSKIVENGKGKKQTDVPTRIVWRNVIIFAYLHLAAVYGAYVLFRVKWLTLAWTFALYIMSGTGITAAAHRLWAHKAYKARLPLRIYLALANAMAFQNDIYEWSRDHRAHHKYSETDADPHNAMRGFFFAHMGWLLCKKHPDVKAKGQAIDMSDLMADPVVRYQKKFYLPLVLLMCFLMPMYVPYALWSESLWDAFFLCSIFRYIMVLHFTWLVNSAAHIWGDRPYDREINPSETKFVAYAALGEGHHNYHHTFPWDYSASEWGWHINVTTMFIDLWAALGLAYDLKQVPKDIVAKRRKFNGDGSAPWYDEKTCDDYLSENKLE